MEVHWGSPRKERLVLRTLDTNPFFLYNLKTLSLRPFSESASVQRRKHWHCHEPYHTLSLSLSLAISLLSSSQPTLSSSCSSPREIARARGGKHPQSQVHPDSNNVLRAPQRSVCTVDDWTNRNGAVRSLSRIYPSSRRGRNVRQVSTSGMDSPRKIVNFRVQPHPGIVREDYFWWRSMEWEVIQFRAWYWFYIYIYIYFVPILLIFGNEISPRG